MASQAPGMPWDSSSAGWHQGTPSESQCAPVRTSSGPAHRIVGFVTEKSPTSVLCFPGRPPGDGAPSSSLQHGDEALLAKAFKAECALPRLQINTDKRPGRGLQLSLKKCKSHADLRSPGTAKASEQQHGQSSAPNSPLSRANASSEPVRIPE